MRLGVVNGKEQGSHARRGNHMRRRRGKHVRERKLQPNHRCPVQRLKLASEREQEIDTRLETRKTTQRGKKMGRENPIVITAHGGARGYNRIRAGGRA